MNDNWQSRKSVYYDIYVSSHNNAVDLLNEAKILFDKQCYPRAYFLAYTALEEISKSQHAADVYTGHSDKNSFDKMFTNHKAKLDGIAWAHTDANSYPDNYIWFGPDIDDVEEIAPSEPLWKKRLASLYIDIDDAGITSPNDRIAKEDAREILHIGNVALKRIWEMTEYWGHQIGTKGLMK